MEQTKCNRLEAFRQLRKEVRHSEEYPIYNDPGSGMVFGYNWWSRYVLAWDSEPGLEKVCSSLLFESS